MKAPNNNSCSYNSSWDHVVTFSGAERIGKTNADSLEFVLPAWVERAAVKDGEIVIYAKPAPSVLIIR